MREEHSHLEDELRRRFGPLLIGPIRCSRGVALGAVERDTSRCCYSPGDDLADHPGLKERAPAVWRWARRKQDAPWVRGRLGQLFGIPWPPADQQGEKCCFWQELAAAYHGGGGSLAGVIFLCCDYYGSSGVMFEEQRPRRAPAISEGDQRRVATALWELLLEEPGDVPEYTDRMYHSGAGVWVEFGIRRGRPFMREVEPPQE
jgi:hypothetical protein